MYIYGTHNEIKHRPSHRAAVLLFVMSNGWKILQLTVAFVAALLVFIYQKKLF